MTIIVKLEELIEAIKKTDDVVFLQFVDNLIKEGELDPNLLPKDILWKIVNARKSEELTNNDIDSIDKVNVGCHEKKWASQTSVLVTFK